MKILITGGAGFVGQRLAMECIKRTRIKLDNAEASPEIQHIVLADVAEPPFWHEGLREHKKISTRFGDISDQKWVNSLFDQNYDVIFHLASIVSSHGEQDFDLALKVNLDGARYLFESIRAQQNNARVVFASSLASFGGDSMPAEVADNTKQTPMTTYGTTKAIGELLINDYSRKGFFDGRSARLPTVIVRPGKPNLAASSFFSGMFREPLSGEACAIPVSIEQEAAISGYRSIVNGIIHLAEIPAHSLGSDRAVGLPAINTSVQEMMQALRNVAGNRPLGEHVLEIDSNIDKIVKGWPIRINNERALKLGFPKDNSVEETIQHYISDYLDNAFPGSDGQ